MEKIYKKELFLSKIKTLYPDRFKKIIYCINQNIFTSFRVNNIVSSTGEVTAGLKKLGFIIEEGPFANSFKVLSYPENFKLSETKYFDEGKIYIQNLSSMIPALILNPIPGENILDLCAAPGSKTSQIADLSHNNANIFAVESNKSRFFAMKKSFQNQGLDKIVTIKARAEDLPRMKPSWVGYFDKILCDVPCTNEGLIRNPDSYDFNYWNPKNAKRLSQLQKKILAAGILLLKKEGTLVYSTCTFSMGENEKVIEWALKKFPDISLEEVGLSLPCAIDGLTKDTIKTKRVLPDENFEAFFVAKLGKLK